MSDARSGYRIWSQPSPGCRRRPADRPRGPGRLLHCAHRAVERDDPRVARLLYVVKDREAVASAYSPKTGRDKGWRIP